MPCIDMIKTGQNIADICHTHGMTMRQMADKIGVTPVAVSKWTNAKAMPTLDNLIIMACIYRVKMDDIIVTKIV